MPHIPEAVNQTPSHPFALLNLPDCRSVFDDDLCA